MAEYNSAEERARSRLHLTGSTPEVRRSSAELLVKLDRIEGKQTEQWVLDVAEGRLPA